ncbi:MAG TPA: GlxA family transcriptional regulator [Thermoleophilaceae bacterium]|nr:GlxA family transcriptional regulator [Thermoleophilaceae bacterium]
MRRVVIVAFPRVQTLDVVGPTEVFSIADRLANREAYTVEVVASSADALTTGSGLRLLPHRTLAATRGPIDTLLVAGGGVREAAQDERLVRWLRSAAARTRRVGSVCTGAFLLAEAGLLDGRRATTHWAACDELARRFPSVEVEEAPIYVRDGDVYTSAGVTAGIDLALAMVEEDLGAAVARDVARWLVLFLRRPGNQAQFSAGPAWRPAEREPLRELQAWIADNLTADLSVAALAERAFMSPRNFARAFRREVGMTPAAYVESARLERARAELEGGEASIEAVAATSGFGTVETMRRAFQRRFDVNPAAYRSRFHTRGGQHHADRHSAV